MSCPKVRPCLNLHVIGIYSRQQPCMKASLFLCFLSRSCHIPPAPPSHSPSVNLILDIPFFMSVCVVASTKVFFHPFALPLCVPFPPLMSISSDILEKSRGRKVTPRSGKVKRRGEVAAGVIRDQVNGKREGESLKVVWLLLTPSSSLTAFTGHL